MKAETLLDPLISICVDSQKRYHHAALDVGREYLAWFFNQQAEARRSAADELQAQRKSLGTTQQKSGVLRVNRSNGDGFQHGHEHGGHRGSRVVP